jgi:hypothetical protein
MPWSATAAVPFTAPDEDARLAAWLDLRAGKLTASRMKDSMSFNKDGRPSIKRSDYMRDLLAERLTGYTTRNFVNAAMEWGLEKEPEAKLVLARITGNKLLPGEFIEHPLIENFGCTPDAPYANDLHGLTEIKCPTTGTFIEWVLAGVVPEEHKPQMLAQLACTKRSYVDFFAYDPRIKEEGKRYFLRRFEPSQGEIARVEEAAIQFLGELDDLFDRFVSS